MATKNSIVPSCDQIMPHLTRVDVGGLRLWFSYKTCVAFQDADGRRCSENKWGAATGRHLAAICTDKESRIDRTQFEQAVAACLGKHGLGLTLPELPAQPPVSAAARKLAETIKHKRGSLSVEALARLIETGKAGE
ncbi:MAG: hypothetical protein EHM35_00690 [Planctomycetaceae bacterium]|nr:MAG: hypothetical protein EHM35_00690 [Planctomycetaceae bacterium]